MEIVGRVCTGPSFLGSPSYRPVYTLVHLASVMQLSSVLKSFHTCLAARSWFAAAYRIRDAMFGPIRSEGFRRIFLRTSVVCAMANSASLNQPPAVRHHDHVLAFQWMAVLTMSLFRHAVGSYF
ncbi:hypothetical protein CWO90_03215 [Bradyrhizobium sp. Leo121]|nr:hypothetical protein CWO90_03215 [Bradyrhizobium sp. Leo121]